MTDLTHEQATRLLQPGRKAYMNPAERQALEAHLTICSPCRRYAVQSGAIEARLRHALHVRWDHIPGPASSFAPSVLVHTRRQTMIRNTFRLAGSLVLGILLVTGLAGIIHTSRPQPAVQPAGSLHPSTTATTRTFPTYTSRPEETSALTRPEIITYTVQEGDTVFAIAGKFDLTPETIIWSNLDTLGDNPDILRVGMEINILPVDGVYYRWMDRDTLDAVAQAHGVSARAILDWPGNRLDATNPSIQPGTMIVIPGGHRHFSEIMQTETPREAAVTPQNTRVLSGSPTPTHMPVP